MFLLLLLFFLLCGRKLLVYFLNPVAAITLILSLGKIEKSANINRWGRRVGNSLHYKREETWSQMCPVIVFRIVPGYAPVSYWPYFPYTQKPLGKFFPNSCL